LNHDAGWALYFEPRRSSKTAKKKYVAHLETVQLDRVMNREEVAHHIPIRYKEVARIKHGIQRMIWQKR